MDLKSWHEEKQYRAETNAMLDECNTNTRNDGFRES